MTEVFLPSPLEKKLEEPISTSTYQIPRPTSHQQVRKHLKQIHNELEAHYGQPFSKSPLREIVQNAYTHNDSSQPITLDLFLANNDLAGYRCVDGGDYFADPAIKNIWEARKDPPASDTRSHGHYLGHVAIYLFTEDIFVDTQQPAIYATQRPIND